MPKPIKKVSQPTRAAVTRQQSAQSPSGVWDRIEDITKPEGGVCIGAYGQSRTGKTTFLSSFPKDLLLIRVKRDDGRRSVYNVPGIQTVELEKLEDIKELVAGQRRTEKFATVALDGATEVQNMALMQVLGISELPEQLGWGIASQNQWGEVGLYTKEHLNAIFELAPARDGYCGCNVVVTALEREFNTEENRGEILAPYVSVDLSPRTAGWFGPRVDYLVQTFIREVEIEVEKKVGNNKMKVKEKQIQYCLRTGPHPVYWTKFRVPKGTLMPDLVVDPDYAKVAKLIGVE